MLLNANVGFLAINTVDNGNGTALRQIASYLSLMSSLASIVLGLVFVGYNRTESRNSVSAAVSMRPSLRSPTSSFNVGEISQPSVAPRSWARNSGHHIQSSSCISIVGVSCVISKGVH